MGTSFTVQVSSDRLMSCPVDGESHLSAKRHRNWRLAPTLWALWLEKTNYLKATAPYHLTYDYDPYSVEFLYMPCVFITVMHDILCFVCIIYQMVRN